MTELTNYRWWTEFGCVKLDRINRLRELPLENARLRKAFSGLTLEEVKRICRTSAWPAMASILSPLP